MQPRNPNFQARVAKIFADAAFIADLGICLDACAPGSCDTHLVVQPRLLQQDGVVHAGVLATLADHTAGAAAGTLMPADEIVLTIEFKVNLLRPARGELVRCRAEVLRPGRHVTVAESSVFAVTSAAGAPSEVLVAKALVTLALAAAPR